MGGASLDDIKSATLDQITTWNFSNDDPGLIPAETPSTQVNMDLSK